MLLCRAWVRKRSFDFSRVLSPGWSRSSVFFRRARPACFASAENSMCSFPHSNFRTSMAFSRYGEPSLLRYLYREVPLRTELKTERRLWRGAMGGHDDRGACCPRRLRKNKQIPFHVAPSIVTAIGSLVVQASLVSKHKDACKLLRRPTEYRAEVFLHMLHGRRCRSDRGQRQGCLRS